MESGKDLYKVLEVSSNASDAEIRAAYKRLAVKYHPDRYPASPITSFELFSFSGLFN